MAQVSSSPPTLVRRAAEGRGDDRVFYEAKWRGADGRQHKRRIGQAWLEPDGQGGWRRPKGRLPEGRLPEGMFDERRAYGEIPRVIAQVEEQEAGRAAGRQKARERAVTFRALATSWLDHVVRVKQIKPGTVRDYRSMLAEPGEPYARGNGVSKGRIMAALGDLPAAEVQVADIEGILRGIEDGGGSTRTVNKCRAVLRAIFNYGMTKASGFGLAENPAAESHPRRPRAPLPLEVFSIEQIEALARAAADGLWRSENDWDLDAATIALYRAEDEQLAELLRIACYTGLRRGELVVLRWRDVRWSERVLVVERALSDGEVVTPKSGRARYVPLADQPLAALERLSRRANFTGAEDYVFPGTAGDRIDPSALRRRFLGSRDAAGLPPLRFHDLRHTAGSLLVRAIDPASVKDILGHADLKTTERYLHAQRASALTEAATRAFTPASPAAPADDPRAAIKAMLDKLTPEEARALLADRAAV